MVVVNSSIGILSWLIFYELHETCAWSPLPSIGATSIGALTLMNAWFEQGQQGLA